MKLNVISVCSQYTAEELLAASARAKAQSDFLALQWEQVACITDLEDFLPELQRSVNDTAITVVLDGSDGMASKSLIAEGLDLNLEIDRTAQHAAAVYCEKHGISPCGTESLLPAGAVPLCSENSRMQGFLLVRGNRCIAVFPATLPGWAEMFCKDFYGFLLQNGAETAVVQTMAIRESKVADVEEYLRLFKHGKNVLPFLYEENGQAYLSITAIRSTEEQSRQACESLLENLQAEMGEVLLTEFQAKQEKRAKNRRSLPDPSNYDPEVEKSKSKKKKEKREKPKKEGMGLVRKLLLAVCICTFLGSSGYLANRYYQSVSNGKDYANLREVYENGGFPSIGYPFGYDSAFSGLYQINKDVAGWLSIDGTSLDYPVVQGDDNLYYHRLSFEGDYSLYGVPFVDCGVNLKEPSTNTIIYGHNIKNDDQMFNSLTHYWNVDYYVEHPIVTFHTIYGERKYKIFAAFVANVNPEHGEVFQYHTFIEANDLSDVQEFIYNVEVRSVLKTGVDVQPSDKLLTLSTCTYEFDNARFVVVARELRSGESETVDAASVSKASNPLMPDIWYQLYGGSKPVLQVPNFEDTVVLGTTETEFATSEKSEKQIDFDLLQSAVENSLTASLGLAVQTVAQQEKETDIPVLEQKPSVTVPESSGGTEGTTPPQETAPTVPTEGVVETPVEEVPPATVNTEPSAPEKTEEETAKQTQTEEKTPLSTPKEEPKSEVKEEPKVEEEPEDEDENENNSSNYDPDETLSVKINGKTVKKSAYDVVCMMVQAEMGSTFHQEALKAQAVAAYTYVKYNNSAGISPSIATKSSISSNVEKAVSAVIGEAVYYKGNYANSTYCAANAGVSNSCQAVWGGYLPYLVSVDSEGDKQTVHYGYETKLKLSYVEKRLEDYCNMDPYDYSDDPTDWFGSMKTGDGLYVDTIKVLGSNVKGRTVRESLLQYNIRSSAFEVEYDEDAEVFVFTTYGYGHGVGMSQLGANYYAKQGWSYDEILEHYYTGTSVY